MIETNDPVDYGRYENREAVRFDMLRMVACGQRGQKEILRVMGARGVGNDVVLDMLAQMLKDGHLTQLRGGPYAVTNEGRKLMPSPDFQFTHGQYKPPPPAYRRVGSERSDSLPSMAGGVLRYRGDA